MRSRSKASNGVSRLVLILGFETLHELYTSLKDEMKRLSTGTKSFSWKNICILRKKQIREDKVQTLSVSFSQFGIEEQVLDSAVGEWIVVDLNTSLFEQQQTSDIAYLRERYRRKSLKYFCSMIC